jgi:hypothetical protein
MGWSVRRARAMPCLSNLLSTHPSGRNEWKLESGMARTKSADLSLSLLPALRGLDSGWHINILCSVHYRGWALVGIG